MQKTELPRAGGTVAKWLAVREQLPEIDELGELRALTTVYYPIALLRMRLEEYSFEDFNAVEQSMLRFYACGVTDAEELRQWMALPSVRYVQERLALLTAEGLIENGRVTAFGQDSLHLGQKKNLYDAEQLFQADAITGLLLPHEYQTRDDHLIDRTQTSSALPHMAHSESIALSTIQRAIEGPEKIRSYKRYRKSILNVNVNQVESVRVSDIKYIKALMAWPVSSRVPLMFLPYFKRSESGPSRHCDMPLFIPESISYLLPELSEQVETVADQRLTGLVELYRMILDNQSRLDTREVAEWLEQNTVFRVSPVPSDRMSFYFDWQSETQPLSPLELELYAALGAGTPIPVEAEMTLDGRRRRVTVWPYARQYSDRVKTLSEHWSEYGWKLCKRAPLSLRDAVAAIQKKLQKEED